MSTGTMTTRGRITIPKAVRDELGPEAGSEVLVEIVGPGDARLRLNADPDAESQ